MDAFSKACPLSAEGLAAAAATRELATHGRKRPAAEAAKDSTAAKRAAPQPVPPVACTHEAVLPPHDAYDEHANKGLDPEIFGAYSRGWRGRGRGRGRRLWPGVCVYNFCWPINRHAC